MREVLRYLVAFLKVELGDLKPWMRVQSIVA